MKKDTDKANKRERIKELTSLLKEASKAYYKEDKEIMSNLEYDKLYDELAALEEETGIVMAGSPTREVGYQVSDELPKEAHESPMLSLDKTKSSHELAAWLGDKDGLLSWKLDGLTVALTYDGGALQKAVTRGDGKTGEVITPNARTFINLPVTVPYEGRLIVRGEAVISYSDFEKINREIPEVDAKYKNPRNLCSGSVRQLNSEITASRRVRFMAFSLVEGETFATRSEEMSWLATLGFDTVYGEKVTGENVEEAVSGFAAKVEKNDLPSDGLVLIYDDIEYGKSLGRTAKFPRDSIAFKWEDETAETVLERVLWSPSRTGLINPVAIFQPVELEGTTVSRASVHNVSILKELRLIPGDRIKVYKANMIIPQVAENLSHKEAAADRHGNESNEVYIPETCPACGSDTEIKKENDVEALYCTNPACPAKRIKSFELFAGRTGANIDGMSISTIEKFVGAGIIKNYGDFFRLARHRDEIVNMEGFGEKSFEKLVDAAEKAKEMTPAAFLCGLGIPGIGSANAGLIERYITEKNAGKDDEDVAKSGEDTAHGSIILDSGAGGETIGGVASDKSDSGNAHESNKGSDNIDGETGRIFSVMAGLSAEELETIPGLGPIIASAYEEYFKDPEKSEGARDLVREIRFIISEQENTMEGITVVITGKLNSGSRDELKKKIEGKGGKVAGSVSGNTDWLITNDPDSGSSKNKKARELGVAIITEEDFLKKYGI